MESVYKTVAQMNEEFYKRMAEFELKLQKDSNAPATVASLSTEFTAFKLFTSQALNNLQGQLEIIAGTIDNLEVCRRRKILLLHGVAEQKTENLSQVVSNLVKLQFKIDFSAEDINRCQRLGRSAATQKPRPILFKLKDLSVRDKIWFSKTKLKGSGITISEFLTKSRHGLFIAAREKLGVNKCWTKQGDIYFVGCDGKHRRLTSISELNKVEEAIEKPVISSKASTMKTKRTTASKK